MARCVETYDVSFDPPDPQKLVEFYVNLHSPRKSSDLLRDFGEPGKLPLNTIVCTYSHNGSILAVLRASRDGDICTVLDVAVHPDCRGCGYFEGLVDKVRNKYSDITYWRGETSEPAKMLNRDLTIVQTLYGISLTFGFQKIAEATFSVFDRLGWWPLTGEVGIFLALAFALSLLGIRFYWGVSNIRRFVIRRLLNLQHFSRRLLIIVDIPLLFMQAVLFFLLCRISLAITEATQDELSKGAPLFILRQHLDKYLLSFASLYSLLLIVNVAWLLRLTRNSKDKQPERFWMWNNICSAAVSATLGLVLAQIIWPYLGDWYSNNLLKVWILYLLIFVANSGIDLYKVRAYLLGDHL